MTATPLPPPDRPAFDLAPGDDPMSWRLPLAARLCAGSDTAPFLFGGTALAAAVTALEMSCGRPVAWATAQYVGYVRPPALIDIVVTPLATGRQITQAVARLAVADRPAVVVSAALGLRADPLTDQWVKAPAVPDPEQCPAVNHRNRYIPGVESWMDARLAAGRFPTRDASFGERGDGIICLWVKPEHADPTTHQMLSMIADYMSVVCSHAIGGYATGNSLDNTVRFLGREASEWVLCRVLMEATHAGVAVVRSQIFSQGGRLLASATTSLILRAGADPHG